MKAHVKGNDIITYVISANKHFASTFSRCQSTPKSLLAGYIWRLQFMPNVGSKQSDMGDLKMKSYLLQWLREHTSNTQVKYNQSPVSHSMTVFLIVWKMSKVPC